MKSVLALSLIALWPLSAQDTKTPESRQLDFAVMLDSPPVAARVRPSERNGFAALSARRQIQTAQAEMKSRITSMKVPVTGSSDTLVNAVYVKATREQALEIARMSGVRNVSLTLPLKRKMDRAIDLQNVRQAWANVGGQGQAGAGIKIAVIDSGIDQAHPALTDPSMKAPAGFPLGDAAFTTGKVIAARSYISQLTSSDVKFSSPDDTTPRDRVGHGTALAAIAAGAAVQAPLAQISGIAPKAWLGNYKIFGTPGIHDITSTAVFVQALEDAYSDGMDIAIVATGTLPLAGPLSGPLDTANECNATQIRTYIPANACDINAYAVEHAIQSGMLVVVAAGNDGCAGFYDCPTLGTINSPATAPSALTVGSIVNGRQIYSKVKINGEEYRGLSGNGIKFTAPLTAPAVDINSVVPSATTACSGAPANSLTGKIVLLAYSNCATFQQVSAAQEAGAIAVLLYNTTTDTIFQQNYLMSETGIPVEYVGSTAGNAIRAAIKSNPNLTITIDPTLTSVDVGSDVMATNSSRGPSMGLNGIKPEIAAIGSNVYTATQTYDPNGDVWDGSGYAGVDGTSYAAAMVAGAAALVKQAHPGFSPAQIKSALVNTASAGLVSDPLTGGAARTNALGAGKLNAGAAVATNVTANPSVLGFGVVGTALPAAIPVELRNSGSAPVTLTLNVVARDSDSRASVAVNPGSVTIAPGQSQTVNVSMSGTVPNPGTYDGQINISGGGADLHLPYNYIVSDKVPANTYPVYGDSYFALVTEQNVFIAFRTIDKYGAPIVNAPVAWQPLSLINQNAYDRATDAYGVAAAFVIEPSRPSIPEIDGYLSSTIYWPFYHFVNFQPFISGAVNAGSFQSGSLAPGSYVAIFGSDFASNFILPTTGYLPISLGMVSVTFDAPGISVPAPVHFVSNDRINVQIPWELAGQNTATIKVRYRDIAGQTSTLSLAPVSPAYFEYKDATNNQQSVVAQDASYTLITSQHPAVRGQPAVLYANGLGPVTNTPGTGQRSSGVNLSRTTATPEVTIGGRPAQILFSGMTPDTVGLYQINVVVPDDAPIGLQSLTLSVNGVAAKVSQIVIQ